LLRQNNENDKSMSLKDKGQFWVGKWGCADQQTRK